MSYPLPPAGTLERKLYDSLDGEHQMRALAIEVLRSRERYNRAVEADNHPDENLDENERACLVIERQRACTAMVKAEAALRDAALKESA